MYGNSDVVSILVLMDNPGRHLCGYNEHVRLTLFQSLFLWIIPEDVLLCRRYRRFNPVSILVLMDNPGRLDGGVEKHGVMVEFQSLFLWIIPEDLFQLINDALSVHCFNPCSYG